MAEDYYMILGVPRQAGMEDIRRAYLELAKRYHPDVYHGLGGDLKFKLLNEAYQTLSDPARKRRYDLKLRYGAIPAEPSQADKDRMRRYSINYEMLRRRREEERRERERLRRRFRIFDRFIFWSLLALGLAGLGFSLADLFVNLRFHGLIFCLIICAVIYYTFRSLRKKKHL
jgi:curved DNA-binding protein CbpA